MWDRLKSSLLSASLATALVLAFMAVAEPSGPTPAAEKGPLHGLTGLDAERERAAFALAVTLTALAIDAAVETQRERASDGAPAAQAEPSETEKARRLPALRMPFYSFAARSARRAESGA